MVKGKCNIEVMLDDLKFIHQRDGADALGDAERQWKQLQFNFDFDAGELKDVEIANIVVAGMGGSALAALVSKSWPGYSVPFEVCRNYHIPRYVNDKTLFIADSYSGNTEETLSAIAEAEDHNARIVVIATGGKLADIAKEKGYALLLFPTVVQPRYALMYTLRAIVTITEALGLNHGNPCLEALKEAGDWLKDAVKDWTAVVPTDKNPAKKLAYELAGKSVVIYAGPMLAPVAYKWKINCNENAKNVAWWNELPEFDHNELMGWTSHPTEKPYAVVELRSNLEHPRVQKRFEVGEELLSGRRPAPEIVEVQGETLLEQICWATAFGDFVTMYLALLNNVDPGTSEVVEKFKQQLG
jgi:glucose/mannose-6-phosphate isomerase